MLLRPVLQWKTVLYYDSKSRWLTILLNKVARRNPTSTFLVTNDITGSVAVIFLFLESAYSSIIFQILRFLYAEESFCISIDVIIALEANVLEKILAVKKKNPQKTNPCWFLTLKVLPLMSFPSFLRRTRATIITFWQMFRKGMRLQEKII